MNKQQLEAYIHEQIPLTRHMEVSVTSYTQDCVELAAPLRANSNLHGTAFGGSIGSLAVLCGWTWLHQATTEAGIPCDLVVQKTDVFYDSAITEDFSARCEGSSEKDWERFMQLLTRKHRSRIKIPVEVYCSGEVAARLTATYAARLKAQ